MFVTEVHGKCWYKPVESTNATPIKLPTTPTMKFEVWNPFDEDVYPGLGHVYSRLDAHILMWGKESLDAGVELTLAELVRPGKPPTNCGKFVKFQGLQRLATCFEFGNCSNHW